VLNLPPTDDPLAEAAADFLRRWDEWTDSDRDHLPGRRVFEAVEWLRTAAACRADDPAVVDAGGRP
jgi:hypothetical protein